MQSKLTFFSLKAFYAKVSGFATVDAVKENTNFKGPSFLQIFSNSKSKPIS